MQAVVGRTIVFLQQVTDFRVCPHDIPHVCADCDAVGNATMLGTAHCLLPAFDQTEDGYPDIAPLVAACQRYGVTCVTLEIHHLAGVVVVFQSDGAVHHGFTCHPFPAALDSFAVLAQDVSHDGLITLHGCHGLRRVEFAKACCATDHAGSRHSVLRLHVGGLDGRAFFSGAVDRHTLRGRDDQRGDLAILLNFGEVDLFRVELDRAAETQREPVIGGGLQQGGCVIYVVGERHIVCSFSL